MKPLIVLLLCLVAGRLDVVAAFRAGIAVRVVTPDPLLPVIGGVGTGRPVTGKAGELTVRALVLEGDSNRVAIVSADFLGFPAMLGNRVRAGVRTIPPDHILIGATHTHSAPDCYGFRTAKAAGAAIRNIWKACARAWPKPSTKRCLNCARRN